MVRTRGWEKVSGILVEHQFRCKNMSQDLVIRAQVPGQYYPTLEVRSDVPMQKMYIFMIIVGRIGAKI